MISTKISRFCLLAVLSIAASSCEDHHARYPYALAEVTESSEQYSLVLKEIGENAFLEARGLDTLIDSYYPWTPVFYAIDFQVRENGIWEKLHYYDLAPANLSPNPSDGVFYEDYYGNYLNVVTRKTDRFSSAALILHHGDHVFTVRLYKI